MINNEIGRMKMNRIKGKHVPRVNSLPLRVQAKSIRIAFCHSMLAHLNVVENLGFYTLADIFIVQKGTHLE